VHGVYQIFIEAAVQVLVSLKGDYWVCGVG